MNSTVGGIDQAPPAQHDGTWVDESLQRYMNPNAFAAKGNENSPAYEFQQEISLASPEGQDVKLQVGQSYDWRGGVWVWTNQFRSHASGRRSPRTYSEESIAKQARATGLPGAEMRSDLRFAP